MVLTSASVCNHTFQLKQNIAMKLISICRTWAAVALLVIASSCTDNFTEINKDPNNPIEVSTGSLMANAQKGLLDDIYDEWYSGRQSYLYAQYFAQRNYTEEDRYQLRQPVNNNYWTFIYGDVMDLVEIIRLNTEAGAEGNQNEIAAARILKAWAMQILTDTYGDIPYFEAFKTGEDVSPVYTPQSEIYQDLIKELTEAAAQINVDESMFGDFDLIYGGDASKWKKFANSLKMRVAIRTSKVDPNYLTHIQDAIAGGVFESNADNAKLRFLGATPNAAPLYDAFYFSNRNDFTLAMPFVDLLTGRNDEANGKTNPFAGLFDPRLAVWTVPNNGEYIGMPYGITNDETAVARPSAIDLTEGGATTAGNLALTFMDFAEVAFIRSEVENWSQEWYETGIMASLEDWAVEGAITGDLPADYDQLVEDYLAGLPPASMETVLTQKYIALFLQGYEAWAELRRTDYPKMVVRPGEVSYINPSGTPVIFEPLVGDDIPNRINYPIIEQSLNATSYADAVGRMGSDELGVKVWWDVD
jgi:hypothetical protein